jgi:hypothetical protein
MAGASAERQEQGLVDGIKAAIRTNQNNPVTVKAGSVTLVGVNYAEKYTGRQAGGSEPYTDVVIKTIDGKEYNLSMKGPSAPSLAGGGLSGLELAVPGLAKKFMLAASEQLKKDKLNPGDKIPDIYGKIGTNDKITIVVGNKAMGGPIDYMYIGPMNVNAPYDAERNIVTLNGELHEAKSYARSHDLYFRLRARREDQRYDPSAKDASGTPKIYGKSPSKGDSAGRIVVTDKVPSSAKIVRVV